MRSIYGLLGFPLGHSCSPQYFNEKFKNEHIEAEYRSFELQEAGDMLPLIHSLPELKGFNVTIPHKQHIIPFLDKLSDDAEEIGAVNCVKIDRRGDKITLTGYNTDVEGFKSSLLRFLPDNIHHALVLGNGGAAKAVRYALRTLGIQMLTVSRTPQTPAEIHYRQVREYIKTHLLIINTTPLGTWPKTEACPDIPYELLTSNHYLFDLVYNPPITEFLKRGTRAGAHVCNGAEMWLGQALKSWEIWNL